MQSRKKMQFRIGDWHGTENITRIRCDWAAKLLEGEEMDE